jgi:DNA-binding NarL/FixJ family response regulator
MKTILLLEDLPEIRAWLKTLVLQAFPDGQISEAARVHDALELVSAIKFDLALVDLGLPDGSGVDVVEKLRETQSECQSVVVTIHDDDEHLFPALQAGAFGYILKEQPREAITEQLQRMSQGEPPLSPSIARRVIAYFATQAKPQQPDLLPHVSLTERESCAWPRASRCRRSACSWGCRATRSPITSSRSTASSTSAHALKPRSKRSGWGCSGDDVTAPGSLRSHPPGRTR